MVRPDPGIAAALGVPLDRLELLSPPRPPEFDGSQQRSVKVWDSSSGRAWRVDRDQPASAEFDLRSDACHPSLTVAPGSEQHGTKVLTRWRVKNDAPLDREAVANLPRDQIAALALAQESSATEAALAVRQGIAGLFDFQPPTESFGPFIVDDNLSHRSIMMLCRNRDVIFVGPYAGPERLDSLPTIAESLPMTRTNRLQGEGLTGWDTKVAILEGGMPDVPDDPRACFKIVDIQDGEASPREHIGKVAAMVGNRWTDSGCAGEPEGYAPGAPLLLANLMTWSQNGEVSDWSSAARWAIQNEAEIINMSFHPLGEELDGALDSRDVFFDYLITRYPTTVFASAGNGGDPSKGESAYTSGKGYNFLSVADVGNNGQSDRCASKITPESSWRNPVTPHQDRELPELAMPGTSYAMPRDGQTDFSGTSAATPAASGVAALLLDIRPELHLWPEAVRAILLATADYQLADGELWAPSPYRDGHDGVGLINAWQAREATLAPRGAGEPTAAGHDYGKLTAELFGPWGEDEPTDARAVSSPPPVWRARAFRQTWQIEAPQPGTRIRAAITWASNVDSPKGPSVLDVDLDLMVFDSEGELVGWSVTFDNNYEMVDIRVATPGTYTIVSIAYDVPADLSTYYGVAWMTSQAGC